MKTTTQSVLLLAAALGATIPIGRERQDKTCSKCLKPFSNRGVYCRECYEAMKKEK